MRPLFGMVLFCSFVLSSCKHPLPEKLPDFPVDPNVPEGCDPQVIYFQQQVLPIFQSSCAVPGCHDSETHEEGIILDSYANIINTGEITAGDPGEGDIYEKITETDPDDVMPPSPYAALTTQQINTIFYWIQQGAQNNSCEGTGCDLTNVTYSGKIKPIIDLSCKGCHSGPSPQGNIAITNYTQLKSIADNGSLWGSINWGGGDFTDMPYNGTQLSACKKDIINTWLDAGAPNN
jgi:uncharacterized membrane protein